MDDAAMANLFVNGRLWVITHFYGIGNDRYAFGYRSQDGIYHFGITRYVAKDQAFRPCAHLIQHDDE